MHQEKPAVLAHRRGRWMRPDADRWLRPDWRDRKYWAKPPAEFDEKSEADTWSGKSVEATGTDGNGLNSAELRSAQASLAHLRWLVADLKFDLVMRRLGRKYSPDQPRVPAGSAEGGQWTDAAGEGGRSDADERIFTGRSNAQLQEESPDRDLVVAQRETGILLGQAIIHPSNGGGKNCFYHFSYGIIAWRMTSLNMACPTTLDWSAVTHSPLLK